MSKPTHRAHRITTRHARALHPMGGDSLGLEGVVIGRDLTGNGTFAYDEFEAYNARPRIISSPNQLIVGMVGYGKSSLNKSLVYRQVGVLPRRAWVIDPKGEYGPVARALGCEPIRLRPGGELRLNPLAPQGGWSNQVALLSAVSSAALERKLRPVEISAGREALRHTIDQVAPQTTHGEPLINDVADVLLRPPAEVAHALNLDQAAAADHTRDLALALGRLVRGDLAGMFDGPTSPGLNVTGRVVDLDLSAVYEHTALGVLMTCATSWMRAQMDEARENGDDTHTHVIVDEAWRIMADEACARWLQDSTKHARAYGRAVRLTMHRLSDLEAAGAQGSRTERLATGLLAECETRVIYRQPESEVERLKNLVGLTDNEADVVQRLAQGVALWKIGHDRSFIVRHDRSAAEEQLTDTDSVMAGAA